ncbi:MAG: genomic island protein [Gemmatimonadetes bacterium]|nr:genomic island protein [Gemmatimonadota bacterium]
MSEEITIGENVAAENWTRFMYGMERGHRDYIETARFLEGYYLGGLYGGDGKLKPGGHWSEADLQVLDEQRRPAYEINQIMPALNSAFGYQISNRMDISFRPRSGAATKELADSRSKVVMQIANNNKLHWKETEVFCDGMIQQRGYFDVRMDFEDSEYGELRVNVDDPMDVIPDPDAKGYDPKTWSDVLWLRWMTLDEIEGDYGKKARNAAESAGLSGGDDDYGEQGDIEGGEPRAKFAFGSATGGEYLFGSARRMRIIDRQRWIRSVMDVAIFPGGDIRQLNGDESDEALDQIRQSGAVITKKRMKRVRWSVSTKDTTLHDDWSPYDRFTKIPYFPYFRRGQTRGMVDNAVGPQRVLDKGVSQAVHIINTTANSGWQMEQGQLTNMSAEQLQENGAQTGLVLERKTGTPPLLKIQSNSMPHGIDKLIEIASISIGEVTVPPAMRGIGEGDEPGIAIQSRQSAAQQQLAVPLDNLARTRNLLADWFDYGIGKYYKAERVFRITDTDPTTGKEIESALTINQFDPASGLYLNDMTSGEYETVVTEQPMQVTFENSQFTQAMEMRKNGIGIPETSVVRKSNLSDKAEIIEQMQNASAPQDPLAEAKKALMQAQTRKTDAEAVNKSVEGMFSATSAANQIAMQPSIAPVADQMLASAGFQDADAAPAIPNMPAGIESVPMQENTNPLTPTNPAVGMNEGIETGEFA